MDKLIELLGETLIKAEAHLDYCNYGDKWERECAIECKLDKDIIKAIDDYKLSQDKGQATEKIKFTHILSYEEMASVLSDKMHELSGQMSKNLKLRTTLNNCLTAMLEIKDTYPHIFEECVTEDMAKNICSKE